MLVYSVLIIVFALLFAFNLFSAVESDFRDKILMRSQEKNGLVKEFCCLCPKIAVAIVSRAPSSVYCVCLRFRFIFVSKLLVSPSQHSLVVVCLNSKY